MRIGLTVIILLVLCGCSSSPKYAVSDHYDGKRFSNPTGTHDKSLQELFTFLKTSQNKAWPKWIDSSPELDLDSSLDKDEVAITFVNHATVLIQTQKLNILTDPVWSQRVSPLKCLGPKRVRDPGIPFEQLPPIDLVLVSHNHYDHLDLNTLIRLDKAFHPQFIVPLGNEKFLKNYGIEKVYELDWWQSFPIEAAKSRIILTPTQHISGRGISDRLRTLWGSFVIQSEHHNIYFGGDTAYSKHFKDISRQLGGMDLAFLPIGAYEPRWFMRDIHLDPTEAVQAHIDLKSKQSIGIHFGTFQLTEEAIDDPILDLEKAVKIAKLDGSSFITLAEGKTRKFKLFNATP